jgi:transcriptional regulator with XRE-family HTH domain
MDEGSTDLEMASAPELTELGKSIELLRIELGLAKQQLARSAGISRQQLWRVMTGKSELTSTLATRLAAALGADPRLLSAQRQAADVNMRLYPAGVQAGPSASPDFAAFVASPALIERTLRTLPSGEAGKRLKRDVLNSIEEIAGEAGLRLDPHFFAIRGRVINGEI